MAQAPGAGITHAPPPLQGSWLQQVTSLSGACGSPAEAWACGSMNGDDGTAFRCAWAAAAAAKAAPALGCADGPIHGVLLWLLPDRSMGDRMGHSIGEASSSDMEAHLRRADDAACP